MFEGELFGLARRAVGVDQLDAAEGLPVVAGQSDEASLVADRTEFAHRVVHELLALERIGLGVGLGRDRSGAGEEVSEAVLDTGGETGQLVHGGGDAVLPLVGQGGPGEDVVHGALLLQLRHQRGESFVDRVPLLDRPEQLPGVLAVAAAGLGVVERGAGRLSKGVDEEAVLVGRRLPGADEQVAEQSAGAAQAHCPAPAALPEVDGAVLPSSAVSCSTGSVRSRGARPPRARVLGVASSSKRPSLSM